MITEKGGTINVRGSAHTPGAGRVRVTVAGHVSAVDRLVVVGLALCSWWGLAAGYARTPGHIVVSSVGGSQ